MSAERYDIKIDQGSTFELEIELFDDDNNPDETAYTAAGMIKKSYTSNSALYEFDCAVANGVLTVSMDSLYTANMVPGRYVYDVKIYISANNYSDRLIEGVATVTPGVTTP